MTFVESEEVNTRMYQYLVLVQILYSQFNVQ
jgi:hypothetical protein